MRARGARRQPGIFFIEKTRSSSSLATAQQRPTAAAIERESRGEARALTRLIRSIFSSGDRETPTKDYEREILILYTARFNNKKGKKKKKKTHDECSQPHKASFFLYGKQVRRHARDRTIRRWTANVSLAANNAFD